MIEVNYPSIMEFSDLNAIIDSLHAEAIAKYAKYVPPTPGSERWNEAAEAYFRSKWMASSDGILFLDRWRYEK